MAVLAATSTADESWRHRWMTACGAVGKRGMEPDLTDPPVIVGFHAYRHEVIVEYALVVFSAREMNYAVRYVVEMGGCYRCVVVLAGSPGSRHTH